MRAFGATFFFMALISSAFLSCKDNRETTSLSGILINVEKGSGDDFSFMNGDEVFHSAPYPFNMGVLQIDKTQYEVMVLSRRVEEGTDIDVIPFAELTVENGKTEIFKVVISYPVEKDKRIYDIEDFNSFNVKHFALKHIIEYWYANRYGLDGSRIVAWRPISLSDLIQ